MWRSFHATLKHARRFLWGIVNPKYKPTLPNLSARRFLTHCSVPASWGPRERSVWIFYPYFLLWSLLPGDRECTRNMNEDNDYPRMTPQWSHLWTTVRTNCGTLQISWRLSCRTKTLRSVTLHKPQITW